MKSSQQVAMAIAYVGSNKSDMANKLGMTRQNFGMKLKRDTLTKEELEQIGEALGGKYVAYFEFPDGTKI